MSLDTSSIVDLTNDPSSEEPTPAKQPQKRKRRGEPKAQPEKRVDALGKTVRYQALPSQRVEERIARALPGSGHRLFVINRRDKEVCTLFDVLGATGNCYTVSIGKQPSCTCPDSQKNNICKHRVFVMLRVLKVDRNNPVLWQKALLQQEVEAILKSSSPIAHDVSADPSVCQELKKRTNLGENSSQYDVARDSVKGDCPICTDDMQQSERSMTFCANCKNHVHNECIQFWITARKGQSLDVTCPLCRSKWVDGQNQGASGANYVNLAHFSKAHKNQDSSLEALYGDRAVWIRANKGEISKKFAARTWATLQH